jgi:hypothetical protein
MEKIMIQSKAGYPVEVTFPVTREQFQSRTFMIDKKTRDIQDSANFMSSEILFGDTKEFNLLGGNRLHSRFIRTQYIQEIIDVLKNRFPDASFTQDPQKRYLFVTM